MRRPEDVELGQGACRFDGILPRKAVTQVRGLSPHVSKRVASRCAPSRAEELQNATKLDRFGFMHIGAKLQSAQAETQRCKCCIALRLELLRERIVRVFNPFSPAEPNLVDGQL